MRTSERSVREFSSGKCWLKRQPSVFARGFGKECFAKNMRKRFHFYAVIVDIHILRFQGESHCFGFVWYKKEEDVQFLLKVNPEIIVEGRNVFLLGPLSKAVQVLKRNPGEVAGFVEE